MTDTLAYVSETTGEGYRLGQTLGAGAVASVVRVTDAQGGVYAGKVLHASHEQDEGALARFMQEAQLLRDLEHENLVNVHRAVEIEGRRVLLMELVEGPTLQEVIAREAPMPEARLVALAIGIAAGLGHAHEAGIIHRDLKPSNVLVAGSQVPKIADFGMARATSLAGVDHNAFTVLGTPDYMAPECLDPLAVDPRTDLYALGCIMYEMATGQPPYAAATPFGVLERHRVDPVPELPNSYSAGLRALVSSLLAKSPADRPQAAATVVTSLERIATGNTAALVPVGDAQGQSLCAGCGQALVLQVGVCMNCGLVTAKVEPGSHSLLIVGPGEVPDKLDSELREKLVAWIQNNPGLRLDPGELIKRIPRLPFTLATRISEASGRALILSLEKLGFECELVGGASWRSKLMQKKAGNLAMRVVGIVAASSAGFAGQMNWVTAIIFPIVLAVAAGITVRRATRRLTKPRDVPVAALPPVVQESLAAVERSLPAIEQPRHRHGLRAVVSRALQLAEQNPDEQIAGELAHAVELATVAAARLDELDRQLAEHSVDESSPESRALLHERDTWSARLLQLTATLDAFAARIASADQQRREQRDVERLDELRARVEALEEVMAT